MKLLDNSCFIDNADVITRFSNHDVIVFGAGAGGEHFLRIFNHIVRVQFVVDNYKVGEEFNGYTVNSLEYIRSMKERSVIIITAVKYAEQIANQLMKCGLKAGADFFVWDDECLYHESDNIIKYINLNLKRWSNQEKNRTAKSEIIIPYEELHDSEMEVLAYFSNYLADLNHCKIKCYNRGWKKSEDRVKSIWKVYESFGAEELIDVILDGETCNKAEEQFKNIWDGISSFEDWNKITIFDYQFGTTFIRDYLRFYTPSFSVKDEKMKEWLWAAIKWVFFWHDYLDKNDVKAVILWDGVHREGYLRDLALKKNIPVIAAHYSSFRKMTYNYAPGEQFQFFKTFYNQLNDEEKKYGVKWAKKQLDARFRGAVDDIPYMGDRSPFLQKMKEDVLDKNDKFKVLICPHSFEDDSLLCGHQLFDNNMLEWLDEIGKISDNTPQLDWYVKLHPNSSSRDKTIMNEFVNKYKRITLLQSDISPFQLQKEGIKVALTIAGTIGHEYPLLGMSVINAGCNPHMSFSFDFNPKSKKEFFDLLFNIENEITEKEIDLDEIYQYYCIRYLYYDQKDIVLWKQFFSNPELAYSVNQSFQKKMRNCCDWKYRIIVNEYSKDYDRKMKSAVESVFKQILDWDAACFYKRDINLSCLLQ